MAAKKKTRARAGSRKKAVVSISAETLNRPVRGDGYMLVGLDKPDAQVVLNANKAGCELANVIFGIDSDVVPHYGLARMSDGEDLTLSFSTVASMTALPSAPLFAANIKPLMQHVAEAAHARQAMLDKILAEDAPIAFDFLPEALRAYCGKMIVITDRRGVRRGVELNRVTKRHGWGSVYVEFEYEVLVWQAGKVVPMRGVHIIEEGQPKRLAEYGIALKVTAEEREALVLRGVRVVTLNETCAYVRLPQGIETRGWLRWERDPRAGRGVIDQVGASTFKPEMRQHDFEDGIREIRGANREQALAPGDLFRVDPYLMVFSLASKKWGRVHVDHVADIEFRVDAFERLVLNERDKRLVYTLVKNTDPSIVSDIVDDKGGGCSLLLHGKPGRGKTLTAEAIAEELRRPLYVASVGELGTTAGDLEHNLQRILLTAHRWNAVLLLDEADVFLEERAPGDVDRNAMVSTFLRLLEYYNGVLILTTNRVRSMDEAFFSRMSLAIHYQSFELEDRAAVIRNLLHVNRVSLPESDVIALAELPANGRQFKNAIRLARFIAREESREQVQASDIRTLIDRVQDFEKMMRGERQRPPLPFTPGPHPAEAE